MSVRTDVTGSGVGSSVGSSVGSDSIEVIEVVGETIVGVTGGLDVGASATDKVPNTDEGGMAELSVEGVGVATMAEVANVDGLAIWILELEEIAADMIRDELELIGLEAGLFEPGNGNSSSNEANQAGT